MTSRRYDAFLLRHWHLPGEAERVEVRHIRSGVSTLVASLSAALDWIAREGWLETPMQTPVDRPVSEKNGARG